jgi:hypothetical protein
MREERKEGVKEIGKSWSTTTSRHGLRIDRARVRSLQRVKSLADLTREDRAQTARQTLLPHAFFLTSTFRQLKKRTIYVTEHLKKQSHIRKAHDLLVILVYKCSFLEQLA